MRLGGNIVSIPLRLNTSIYWEQLARPHIFFTIGVIMKKFLDKFELYLGSVFLSVTFIFVVINVFTRYFLKFTYYWAEEIAVSCFVWVIFLGFAYAYRSDELIGISAIVNLFHGKVRSVIKIITDALVFVISAVMLYFSYNYTANMTKITSALEAPYQLIYSSIVISFFLVCIYSIIRIYGSIKKLSSHEVEEEL